MTETALAQMFFIKNRRTRGILWREWLQGRSAVMFLFALWLIGLWVLMIFSHPGWILGFGCFYAFICTPVFAGIDAVNGTEEFEFALPPTRGERYLVRAALCGLPLLAMTCIGTLAIAADIPQLPWRLIVDSGFTEPFPKVEPGFLYALAISTPLSLFGSIFALSANARSRLSWVFSIFFGLVLTGAFLGLAFLSEEYLWHRINGSITVPLQLLASLLMLFMGYSDYRRKEGLSEGATTPDDATSRGWRLGLIVGAIVLICILLVALVLGLA